MVPRYTFPLPLSAKVALLVKFTTDKEVPMSFPLRSRAMFLPGEMLISVSVIFLRSFISAFVPESRIAFSRLR